MKCVDNTPSFDFESFEDFDPDQAAALGADVGPRDSDPSASGGMPVADERKPTGGSSSLRAGGSGWREVPQARFLSWSPAMQFAYCAARDRDSAARAENDEWRTFYLQRASLY